MEWKITDGLTSYDDATAFMEARVAGIARGDAAECIWLLEHPPHLHGRHVGKDRRPDRIPTAFRFMQANAAASTPITGPVSVWPMSCWT